jgi:hypothetical protein
MRVDALEGAQDVEMQRRRLKRLTAAFAQTVEMTFGGRKLCNSHIILLNDELLASLRIANMKDRECNAQIHNSCRLYRRCVRS